MPIQFQCAWAGCNARCKAIPAPLPDGWMYFVTFRETALAGLLNFESDTVVRDAVLCPVHIEALDNLLVPL